MTITKSKNILKLVIFPLIIIGFTLISDLEAKVRIDKSHTDVPIRRTKAALRGKTTGQIRGVGKPRRIEVEDSHHMKVERPRRLKVKDSSRMKVEHVEVDDSESKILCPNNHCVFNPCLKFGNRSIEDEIIVKYLNEGKVNVRFNILYGRNRQKGKTVYSLDYIPAICFMSIPRLSLFKLCIKMTQATFFEKRRIEFCFSLSLQMLYFFNQHLYSRCMNFTTILNNSKQLYNKTKAPAIRSFKNMIAKLPTLKKLTDVQKRKQEDIIIPLN